MKMIKINDTYYNSDCIVKISKVDLNSLGNYTYFVYFNILNYSEHEALIFDSEAEAEYSHMELINDINSRT